MKALFIALALSLSLSAHADAEKFQRIYLDKQQNVHVVNMKGKDRQLTKDGKHIDAKLSPDGKTAAWRSTWDDEDESEVDEGTDTLYLYHQGKVRTIECEPFVRDYRFWQNSHVAVDCGAEDFAGREVLFDINTLKEVESFNQGNTPADKRPAWSVSNDGPGE